jgi:pimeloyl-ACP methyl ester carboxylesterase
MAVELTAPAREQTRARYPDADGFVGRDGVRVYYEVYGEGEPTALLLPTWSLIHSRQWKMQIPYLARHTETKRAVIVGFSMGGQRGLILAAEYPERIDGAVFIAPNFPGGGEVLPERVVFSNFEAEYESYEDWAKYNKHHWLRDYRDFVEFFVSKIFTEPHSTKPIEDAVGWAMETEGETLVATHEGPKLAPEEARALAARVRCPVLVIHGERDAITSVTRGEAMAGQTHGDVVVLEGSGHAPHVRDPVKVNLLLRHFIAPPTPTRTWVRGKSRRKRALYISSPIGLGHAQRDVAIADELRKLHPDLEIDWLAQHPVTKVLEAQGERIHPAESGHIAGEVEVLPRPLADERQVPSERCRDDVSFVTDVDRAIAYTRKACDVLDRWSWRRIDVHSSTSRCATTSSRTSTCGTGWSVTAPGAAWTSTSRLRR